MYILGLDIGYDRCGFAVFDIDSDNLLESGVITTDQNILFKERLRVLREDLMYIKNKFNPNALSIETLFFYRKNKVFEKICMAKGVAIEVFSDIDVFEIEPAKLKKLITGNGKAKKKDIRKSVSLILNYNFKNTTDDELDAIALGIYLKYLLKVI